MKNRIKKKLVELYYSVMRVYPEAPPELKKNFRIAGDGDNEKLRNILIEKYFDKQPVDYLNSEAGKEDLTDHLSRRLNRFRSSYIPFIDHHIKLKGAKILEIGGGTGCSTLALAEQGADIQSIDIDEDSQSIAKLRLSVCGCEANFHILNATEIDKQFNKNEFDIIIYFASLEHMTYEERLISLKKSWDVLKPGGILFVLEAPNRLWFYDMHTSFMPFYFWLQDDMAIDYGKFSERKLFNSVSDKKIDTVTFSRWGRGVSYHEFELALGRHPSLKNPVGLYQFEINGKLLKQILYRKTLDYKFKKILRKLTPGHIGSPFLESFLDLGLIKISDERNS